MLAVDPAGRVDLRGNQRAEVEMQVGTGPVNGAVGRSAIVVGAIGGILVVAVAWTDPGGVRPHQARRQGVGVAAPANGLRANSGVGGGPSADADGAAEAVAFQDQVEMSL